MMYVITFSIIFQYSPYFITYIFINKNIGAMLETTPCYPPFLLTVLLVNQNYLKSSHSFLLITTIEFIVKKGK